MTRRTIRLGTLVCCVVTHILSVLVGTAHAAPFAYITNESGSVSVIDTASNTVVATVAVGTCPFGIAVNPAATRAYVSNQCSNNVSVIDTATNTVVATVAVGNTPLGVAVNPAGTRAYVAAQSSNHVAVIDTATNTVVGTVAVGAGPYGVAVNPAGTRAYVTSSGAGGNVSVIDTATNTVVATVAAVNGAAGLAVNPAGTRVYVANLGGNSVSVIDTASNTVVGTVAAGTTPFGVAINPAGTRAYVTNQISNNVSVIDTANNTVVATVTVGAQPGGVSVNPSGTRAYVANASSNSVSVIDTATNTVVATVAAGIVPRAFGVFIAPPPAPSVFAYITNESGTVSVIDTASNTVVTTVAAGSCPFGVAVNAAATRAYVANQCSGTVSVIDTASDTVVATVAVGSVPLGIAVNPAGTRAYVAAQSSKHVAVIDTATNTVVATVALGASPYGVAVNPAGTRAYVTSSNVSVIDTATNTVVATVAVEGPRGVAFNAAGTRAYVANGSNTVSVIDTASNTVVATVAVGTNPFGVAVNPAGTRVFVTNFSSDNVSVVDTASNTVVATVPVGIQPNGVAINPAGARAYVANAVSNNVSVIDTASNTVVATVAVGIVPRAFGVFITPGGTSPVDTTPPVITLTVTGTLGNNGWHTSDVSVSWSVTDSDSAISTSSGCGSSTVNADTAGVTFTCSATSAGGTTSESVTVTRDATAPTITSSRSPDANANGWNNTGVTVSFVCSDTLSGVAACASDITLSADGAGQSVTGNTATDLAGNTASATVSDINIDKTAPTITASRTPANSAGWNNGDVTVTFTCSDAVSGLAGLCPSLQTMTSEGAGQSRSGTVADLAGNSAALTISDIHIDKTPPVITGSRSPAANAAGWNNTDVTVTFACSDLLSGVPDGTCGPSPQVVTAEGAGQSRAATAVDKAGNTASATVSDINIDKTAPTITASRTPANGAGWNNTDVTVTFTCNDSVSGLAAPCPSPQTVTTEGAGQSRSSGPVLDLAGNSAASVTVSGINIDKTAPTITGSRTPAANAAGWNNTDVTVTFACSDLLSGVSDGTCGPSPQVVASEGVGQSRTGTVADLAGNTASTSVGNIHIDKTPPVIVILTPTMDSLIASSPVTVQVQAADAVGVTALSVNGVAAALLAGGTPQTGTWQASVLVTLPVPVGGALSFTASAGDLAGNVTVVTTVVDNDGLDAAIDTQPLAYSNDFSDVPSGGTSSGTIAARGGWTVNVQDVSSGGVEAVVSGAGTVAKISTCPAGGAEQIELDGAGETASVDCVTTTDVHTGSQVTAIAATSPTGNPKILVRNAAGKVQARLSTMQSVTIGSPVTAGSTNSGSVLVELLDEEGLMFATFALDAAESVDVTFTTGANNVPVVQLDVLVGPVDFTIGTRSVTLNTGEAGTFPTDVTPPTITAAAVTPTVLWPANHKMVDVAVRYQVTDDRDPAPVCSLSVASNEPLNGTGDGDTSPDWGVIDAHRLQLRAERSATGTGRIYTLTVTCGDASGNLATRQLAVTVPRNRR